MKVSIAVIRDGQQAATVVSDEVNLEGLLVKDLQLAVNKAARELEAAARKNRKQED